MNTITFTVEPKALLRALSVVQTVSPQSQASTQQDRGFLFVVQDGKCRVYSRGNNQEARAFLDISDVDGDGAFVYPADYVSEFECLKGPITFKAESDGNAYKVSYKAGAAGSDRVTFDPGMLVELEKHIQETLDQPSKTFNVNLLKDSLIVSKAFVATDKDKNAKECNKMVQVFGDSSNPDTAKGDGNLYASDGTQCLYYRSESFVGNGLVVPGPCLGLLDKFLGKSSGDLKAYLTPRGTYLVNSDEEVLGWQNRSDTYKKFAYYHMNDDIIVVVDVLSMAEQLRLMRRAIASDRTKIRMHFDPNAKTFSFSSADENNKTTSYPVPIEDIQTCKVAGEITANVNVDHMINLFSGLKGARVVFRILLLEGQAKPIYMLRTIDEFYMTEDGTVFGGTTPPEGAKACVVTRFAPSIG